MGPKEEIYNLAKSFQEKAGFSVKDAIHLACACYAKASFFLTCDNDLIKQSRSKRLKLEVTVMNPVEYIRQEVEK